MQYEFADLRMEIRNFHTWQCQVDTWGQKLDDGDRLCLENSLQLGSRLIQICIPFMRRGRLLEMGINLTE